MQVHFIKTSHTDYTLRCVREDGSVSDRLLNARSFLAHDLVHLAFEREARRYDSFFGAIAKGADPRALMPQPMNGAGTAPSSELMITEMIVGPLQGALKSGRSGQELHAALTEYAKAQSVSLPGTATPELMDQVLAWVKEALVRYGRLRTGDHLAFEFTSRSG